MATNFGSMHMPKIVRSAGGKARSTVLLPGLDGAAIYLGGFVPYVTGSTAAPDGAEFGIPAFGDDNFIYGFVVGFRKKGSSIPIWEDPSRAGTVTDATGELPLKYTFASTNDESNTTSAKLEMIEVMPIMPGDILEVSLWGASTASVARGTTTAAGTTESSDNIGVGLAVNTTYHFALLESAVDKDLDDMDFITTSVDGNKPLNSHRVYVSPLRSFSSLVIAD